MAGVLRLDSLSVSGHNWDPKTALFTSILQNIQDQCKCQRHNVSLLMPPSMFATMQRAECHLSACQQTYAEGTVSHA